MTVTRREFLAGAGAALAAGGTVTGFPAIAQRRPLRVGVFISDVDAQGVDELVGPYVSQMRVGLGLAVSEINAMGGILRRPVELIYRDDGGSPPSPGRHDSTHRRGGLRGDRWRLRHGHAAADHRPSECVEHAGPRGPWLLDRRLLLRPDHQVFCPDGEADRPIDPRLSRRRLSRSTLLDFQLDSWGAQGLGVPVRRCRWCPHGRCVGDDSGVGEPSRRIPRGDAVGAWMESNIIWNADPRPYAVNAVN